MSRDGCSLRIFLEATGLTDKHSAPTARQTTQTFQARNFGDIVPLTQMLLSVACTSLDLCQCHYMFLRMFVVADESWSPAMFGRLTLSLSRVSPARRVQLLSISPAIFSCSSHTDQHAAALALVSNKHADGFA
uniref:Uncharacterized protein n=1 Tax=Rhipicephalus microplus TaxID=6941 RepID=A0A6G5AFB4_RHIMP